MFLPSFNKKIDEVCKLMDQFLWESNPQSEYLYSIFNARDYFDVLVDVMKDQICDNDARLIAVLHNITNGNNILEHIVNTDQRFFDFCNTSITRSNDGFIFNHNGGEKITTDFNVFYPINKEAVEKIKGKQPLKKRNCCAVVQTYFRYAAWSAKEIVKDIVTNVYYTKVNKFSNVKFHEIACLVDNIKELLFERRNLSYTILDGGRYVLFENGFQTKDLIKPKGR